MSSLVPSKLRVTAGNGREQPQTVRGEGPPGALGWDPPEGRMRIPRQKGSQWSREHASPKSLSQTFQT